MLEMACYVSRASILIRASLAACLCYSYHGSLARGVLAGVAQCNWASGPTYRSLTQSTLQLPVVFHQYRVYQLLGGLDMHTGTGRRISSSMSELLIQELIQPKAGSEEVY